MSRSSTRSALGVTTGNIIKNKEASNDSLHKVAIPNIKFNAGSTDYLHKVAISNIKNGSAKALTKTQKAKLKKQEKVAKNERAKLIAEQQKQEGPRSASTSKSPKPSIPPDGTSSSNVMKKSDDNANSSSLSTISEPGRPVKTTTAFAMLPDEEELSPRAKKILAEKREKELFESGVGVVVKAKTPNIRKHDPIKKGRQALTADDKEKYPVQKAAADLVYKRQNNSIPMKRVPQKQTTRNPIHRRTETTKDASPRGDAAVLGVAGLTEVVLDINWSQDGSHYTSSDRAMTATSSESGNEEAPPLAVSVFLQADDDKPVIPHDTTDTADNLHEHNVPDTSSESEDLPDDKVDEAKIDLPMTPIKLPQITVIAPTPVYNDDVSMEGSNNGFAVGDYGDSPPLRNFPSGFAKATILSPQSKESNGKLLEVPADDTNTFEWAFDQDGMLNKVFKQELDLASDPKVCDQGVVTEVLLPFSTIQNDEQLEKHPNPQQIEMASAETEVWDVAFTLEDNTDDVATTESGPELAKMTSEKPVMEATEPPSWVSSFLSLPNATCYPPALTRDQEHELVMAHVTPLSIPVSKSKLSKAEKKATKASNAATTSPEPPVVEPIVPADPTISETPLDNGNEQVDTETSPLKDDKIALSVESAADNYVAHILALPNGDGQTAAERELHERLVAAHVAPLRLPVSKIRKPKAKKLPPASPVEEPAAPETPIDEVSELTLNDEPEPEQKVAEEHTTATTNCSSSNHDANESRSRGRRSHTSRSSSTTSSQSLERKTHTARTTYLGTASLEDFINTLSFDTTSGTTIKASICEAFATLSADETEAIQGKRPVHLDNMKFNSKYTQRRVKLGAMSLYEFLRGGMAFEGDEGRTNVVDVMRAFRDAARKEDARASEKLVWALEMEMASESRQSSRSRLSSGIGWDSGSGSEL
ncbi:hypothetical protein N0V83_003530 [Neocucurbitaria cava]|uniref:Uncharacterized protein n=1 Tax=Neocucurbitaria cava TaxID=798079 RepID=A0A9W8YDD9_9PLEO|nr:hypothetical protein N0V83_003530 [Neocucurbitaria cava]